MTILIKNANVITPFEMLKDLNVLVEGDKIAGFVPKGDPTEKACDKVIDAGGNYLAPGLIDIHNHGNFGHDTMEGTYEALDSMAEQHFMHGVTSFLATTMTTDLGLIEGALRTIGRYVHDAQHKTAGRANVLGVYLEGPYFSEEKKGAQPAEHLRVPNLDELKGFLATSQNTIKVVSLAPELAGAEEAIKYLKNRGITVAAGHTTATFAVAKTAINAGVTLATHLYNGMRNFSHREPGIIGAALTDERVYCELICDGIHLHAGAMDLAVAAKGRDKIVLITDAMMAAGLEDGLYELGGYDVTVKEGTARLADGTLAGSTLTLNRAVRNLVDLVNVPLADAIRMASLNPAQAIGAADRKGSIEVGKDADLVIFDQQLNALQTMIAGQITEL